VAKACKSNGPSPFGVVVSGERVRNTWITYPGLENSGGLRPFAKVPVILDDPAR